MPLLAVFQTEGISAERCGEGELASVRDLPPRPSVLGQEQPEIHCCQAVAVELSASLAEGSILFF